MILRVLKGQGILSNSFNENMNCAVDNYDVSLQKDDKPSNRMTLCVA